MTDMIIVKIPLADTECAERVRKFKKMPILYLELIENKLKVRSDVINKPYEPPPVAPEESKSVNFDYGDMQNFTPFNDPTGDNSDTTTAGPTGDDTNETNREAATASTSLTTSSSTPPTDSDLVEDKLPPTLAELQAKNPKVPLLKKDFRYAQDEDAELIKERNTVFFHYEILKRMHPTAQIPEFTVYSDPKIMAQKYEMLAKKLSLDSNVENWKRYMIIFVMGCEVVLGKMNFDMEGFAQQQIMSMNTYDSLLVEMAEKSYIPTGSKWPVELRLCSMILINVVLFIVSKFIMKRTGINLLSQINGMVNAGPPSEKVMKAPE